jgi:hypothetical protein
MQLKKGGSNYVIPFEKSVAYVCPQVDPVPPKFQVEPPTNVPRVRGIKEAVDLYLTAYWQQFPGPLAAKARGE